MLSDFIITSKIAIGVSSTECSTLYCIESVKSMDPHGFSRSNLGFATHSNGSGWPDPPEIGREGQMTCGDRGGALSDIRWLNLSSGSTRLQPQQYV